MPNKEQELQAAAMVAAALDARYVARDVGRAQATRDFDLLFPDGRVEPLEVTTAMNQGAHETFRRMVGRNWAAPGLTRIWAVHVTPHEREHATPVDIRGFTAAAEPHLSTLERLGVDAFDLGDEFLIPAGKRRDAYEGLSRLGITAGSSDPHSEGMLTMRMQLMGGGFGRPLAHVVSTEAWNEGNRAKLREPIDSDRRHLFVRLDPNIGQAFLRLKNRDPGAAPSYLPDEVTTVWAQAARTLACCTPPDGWVLSTIDDATVANPRAWMSDPSD